MRAVTVIDLDELQDLVDSYLATTPRPGRRRGATFVLPRSARVDDALMCFHAQGWSRARELGLELRRYLLEAFDDTLPPFEDDLSLAWSRHVATELHRLRGRARKARRYIFALAEADKVYAALKLQKRRDVGVTPPYGLRLAARTS